MKNTSRLDSEVLNALKDLQSFGEPDIVEHLLKVYFMSADSIVSDLIHSLEEQDGKKIRDLAHSWRSASLGIGAMVLGELCEQLEKTSQEDHSQHQFLIEALQKEYDHLRTELK